MINLNEVHLYKVILKIHETNRNLIYYYLEKHHGTPLSGFFTEFQKNRQKDILNYHRELRILDPSMNKAKLTNTANEVLNQQESYPDIELDKELTPLIPYFSEESTKIFKSEMDKVSFVKFFSLLIKREENSINTLMDLSQRLDKNAKHLFNELVNDSKKHLRKLISAHKVITDALEEKRKITTNNMKN